MEITPELELLHDKLMQSVLAKRGISLNPIQEAKFDKACWKTIFENDDHSFNDLKNVANIYLNFILKFPGLSL